MKCHKCGSTDVQHYRQLRSDRVWVVTARCKNGHIPEKGKPFYSIALFDLSTLPVLKSSDPNDSQIEFFLPAKEEQPVSLLEWFEQRKHAADKFQPIRRNP